jgi:DNA helicase HerA-like ATPase
MAGLSVFVDVTRSNEVVVENITREICKKLLAEQMRRFAEEPDNQRLILVHFEEAHRLFRSDDKDLTSIYNVLAKEGAKFNIAMAYSTQSVSTVSPDLTKNTDNFFLAHLDDDREIREVSRKYVFRDVAQDLERTQTKGYVRLFTRSHRFALPVQIHLFGLAWVERLRQAQQRNGGV